MITFLLQFNDSLPLINAFLVFYKNKVPVILPHLPHPLVRHPPAPRDVQHPEVGGVGCQGAHGEVCQAVDITKSYYGEVGELREEDDDDLVIQLPASGQVHLIQTALWLGQDRALVITC